MTTTEHLSLIEAKCREDITTAENQIHWLTDNIDTRPLKRAIAGWKSTLVSILFFRLIKSSYAHSTAACSMADDAIASILAAYPIELFQ